MTRQIRSMNFYSQELRIVLIHLSLTLELERNIQQRVKAIAWTGKIHPVRPKCLHRSLALYQWLKQQGIEPQLEIGWQGKVGHAWVTYHTYQGRYLTIAKILLK